MSRTRRQRKRLGRIKAALAALEGPPEPENLGYQTNAHEALPEERYSGTFATRQYHPAANRGVPSSSEVKTLRTPASEQTRTAWDKREGKYPADPKPGETLSSPAERGGYSTK